MILIRDAKISARIISCIAYNVMYAYYIMGLVCVCVSFYFLFQLFSLHFDSAIVIAQYARKLDYRIKWAQKM